MDTSVNKLDDDFNLTVTLDSTTDVAKLANHLLSQSQFAEPGRSKTIPIRIRKKDTGLYLMDKSKPAVACTVSAPQAVGDKSFTFIPVDLPSDDTRQSYLRHVTETVAELLKQAEIGVPHSFVRCVSNAFMYKGSEIAYSGSDPALVSKAAEKFATPALDHFSTVRKPHSPDNRAALEAVRFSPKRSRAAAPVGVGI